MGKVLDVRSGSTGSEFVRFTGPTTSIKDFTLPNSSATILTDATTITVGQGGTGQTSFTNGQVLIGSTSGGTLVKATLTEGSGVTITNGAGTITIAASSAPSAQTITDGATVTLAWLHDSLNELTIGGNRTLAISGTPAKGGYCWLLIKQDGTGGRTLTWPTSGVTFNWPADDEIVLGTTASRTDCVRLTCIVATPGALVFNAQVEYQNSY